MDDFPSTPPFKHSLCGLSPPHQVCFSLQVSLLNPIENPDLKLAIVMLIVPFFVNVSALLHFFTPVCALPSCVPVQNSESDRENTSQLSGPSV